MVLPLIALLFAASELVVRTQPGVVVLIDGAPCGVTTADQGGLHISAVTPGLHQITLQVPGGGSATLPVDVQKLEGATVDVSALWLHAQTTRRGGVEVRTSRASCTAAVDDREENVVDGSAVVDGVAPGRYRVTLRCGNDSLQRDADVDAGRVAILEADWSARVLRPAGDRPKALPVTVGEPGDKLVNLPLPAEFKRAFLNAIPPAVRLLSVRAQGLNVFARFETSRTTVRELIEGLMRIHGLADMDVVDVEFKGDQLIVEIKLTLAVARPAASPAASSSPGA